MHFFSPASQFTLRTFDHHLGHLSINPQDFMLLELQSVQGWKSCGLLRPDVKYFDTHISLDYMRLILVISFTN